MSDIAVTGSAPETILARCRSWDDLHAALGPLPSKERGNVFEALVAAYFQTAPEYEQHRPFRAVRKPRPDLGIDLVIFTKNGESWAIQAKYRHDRGDAVLLRDLEQFPALFMDGGYRDGVLCTTADGIGHNIHRAFKTRPIRFILGDTFRLLDFSVIADHVAGLTPRPREPARPREYQEPVLDAVEGFFSQHSRGKVVLPCAFGKSLIGFWAAQRLDAHKVLVAVPNLSLARQLLRTYTEESVALGLPTRWMVVCSDETVAKGRLEGIRITTEAEQVAAFLRAHRAEDRTILFTTYHSGRVVSRATRKARFSFDLGIFDEAHRTAGSDQSQFGHLLHNENVRVERRVFMTATPRIYKGDRKSGVISMDDQKLYGSIVYERSFVSAADAGILPHLRIVTVAVTDSDVHHLVTDRRFVRLRRTLDVRVDDAIAMLALLKANQQFGLTHVLSFHSNRARAANAQVLLALLLDVFPQYGRLDAFYVDGEHTAAERETILERFGASPCALITNVRVFVEGVDCPAIDAVVFADPRQSVIDITQAVGRALRPVTGKENGFAIIPVQVDKEGRADDEAFEQAVRTAVAIGNQDQAVVSYFEAIRAGLTWVGRKPFEVYGDVTVGTPLDLEKLNQAISLRVLERRHVYSVKSADELKAACKVAGVSSKTEYEKVSAKNYWPSSPQNTFGKSWSWLFDSIYPGDKVFSVSSAEELKAACKQLGVTKYDEYNRVYRQNNWPAAPNMVFDRPWSWFFDSVWLADRVFSVRTAQELKKACKAEGVTSSTQYKRVYKKFDWPSAPDVTFGKPWSWLFDSVYAGNKVFSVGSGEELGAACKKAAVTSQSQYRKAYRDYDWPSNPNRTFGLKWSALFGRRVFSVETAEELKRACFEKGVTSSTQYKRAYKRFKWPSLPDKTFGKPWTYFFDSERSADKEFSVGTAEELRAACNELGVGTQRQYLEVHRKYNWPSHPNRKFRQTWSWLLGKS